MQIIEHSPAPYINGGERQYSAVHEKERFVSILGFLKKIKFPKFEEDLIQDRAEKAMEDAPVSYGGRVVYDPRDNPEIKAAKKDLREWMDGEWERYSDPSDGASMSTLDVWDE